MWVFTLDGFYSAVQHRDEPDRLIVRSRTEFDCLRLRNWLTTMGHPTEVQHTPTADYHWRLVTTHAAFGRYLASVADDIDYPNFKDAVLKRSGYKRANLYGKVWATMLDLQEGGQ